MVLKSFAKINLTLRVNKKLNSGLHQIQSYFSQTNIYDQIKIQKIKGQKDKIKFKGKFAKKINHNNSLIKTMNILREKKYVKDYYFISVDKRIPIFAGLGGGTSNSACLTKYFVKKKITQNLLNDLGEKIGSDIRLFFCKRGLLKNLKEVKSFKKKFNFSLLLIFPNIRCSTKYVYSKVRKFTKKNYKFAEPFNKNKFISFLSSDKNDLQSIVEKKYPIIKRILVQLSKENGCYFSRMTGSGSVCYGIFKSEKKAKAALKKMRLRYPTYWLSVAKTI